MATYKNPWHDKNTNLYGPAYYSTDVKPTEYRGYLIYNRIKGSGNGSGCWDVVKNGECLTQRAGPNGAKEWIDGDIAAEYDCDHGLPPFNFNLTR